MDCKGVEKTLFKLEAAVSEISFKLDAILDYIALEGERAPVEDTSNDDAEKERSVTPATDPAQSVLPFDRGQSMSVDVTRLATPPLPPEIIGRDVGAASDNFLLIKGINASSASILTYCDVQTFTDIARFRAEDVAKFNALLGDSRRIQRENWIEQAAMLADGRHTKYAEAYEGGGCDTRNVGTPQDGLPNTRPLSGTPGTSKLVAQVISLPAKRVRATSPLPPPLPPWATTSDNSESRDDLCLIRGIDASSASILAICDVQTFADVARFRAEDVAKFNELLGDSRRIQRENWIEQAAMLAEGRCTKFARAQLGQEIEWPGPSAVEVDRETHLDVAHKGQCRDNTHSASKIIPCPSRLPLEQGQEFVVFKGFAAWRSIAACLMLGVLALSLVSRAPGNGLGDMQLRSGHGGCQEWVDRRNCKSDERAHDMGLVRTSALVRY